MIKFKKSSILVLLVLVLLLISTPFLPSSLRPTYLFFIFNLLIIALGAEAGLLSAFPRPSEDRNLSPFAFVTANIPEKREASTSTGGNAVSEDRKLSAFAFVTANIPEKREASTSTGGNAVSEDRKQSASAFVTDNIPEKREASTSTGGNAVSELDEKKPKVVKMSDKVKKCPSMPNLLYVGGEEDEAEIMEEELELEDDDGGISEQEQFDKNEAFIGNFYKQLKLQRD